MRRESLRRKARLGRTVTGRIGISALGCSPHGEIVEQREISWKKEQNRVNALNIIPNCAPKRALSLTAFSSQRIPGRPLCLAFLLCAITAVVGCARHEALKEYPYIHPLTSPGTKFAGLPPAAQSAVRAEAGAAQIYDIRKLNVPGRDLYKVLFRYPEAYPPLYIASDGSVLYPDLTIAVPANANPIGAESGADTSGLSFGDLPKNVGQAIHDKAPTAEVNFISKVTVGARTYFYVTFKNPDRHPAMILTDQGVVTNRFAE